MNSRNKIIRDILSTYNNILENKRIVERAQDLRNTLKSLGYSEKGSELTSGGGDVDTKLTTIVSELLTEFKKIEPDVKVRITAGDDSKHREEKYKSSLHNKGKAIDLTIEPHNPDTSKSFISLVKNFQQKYPDLGFIDEYNNPSKYATGPHYHLQLGKTSTDNSNTPSSASTENQVSSWTNNVEFERDPLISAIGNSLANYFDIKESKKVSENIKRIKGLL